MEAHGIILRYCLGYSLAKGLRKSRLYRGLNVSVIDVKNTVWTLPIKNQGYGGEKRATATVPCITFVVPLIGEAAL
jgi:hypothetical protein